MESAGGVEVYEPWESDGPGQHETYEITDPNGPQDFYEVPDSQEPETYEVPEQEQPGQETYEVPDQEPGKHSGLLRCIVVYKGITAWPHYSSSTDTIYARYSGVHIVLLIDDRKIGGWVVQG